MTPVVRRKRHPYAQLQATEFQLPDLVEIQLNSFQKFLDEGIKQTLTEISPIEDYTGSYAVEFGEHRFEDAPASVEECMSKDKTFAAPLFVRVRFIVKETGEIREQDVFMGDFPLMTRVGNVRHQRYRAGCRHPARAVSGCVRHGAQGPDQAGLDGEPHAGARVLAGVRGRDQGLRLGAHRPQAQAAGHGAFEGPRNGWAGGDSRSASATRGSSRNTLERDDTASREDALLEVFRRQRPGEPVNLENAQNLVDGLFFDAKRYDLSEVGRYKVNKKLKLDVDPDIQTLTIEDIEGLLKRLIQVSEEVAEEEEFGRINYERIRHKLDEYEHFGNRRLRTVGELVQEAFRIGMYRMERVVRERMTTQDEESITPQSVVNTKPVASAIKEFFGSSQLSQFMDQTNTLSGLSHRRRSERDGRGRLEPRAGAHRGSRRAPDPLRADVPHRDARGTEHRAHRAALDLRDGRRVRLLADAVPQGRGRQGDRRDRVPLRRRGGGVHDRPGQHAGQPEDGRDPRRRADPGAQAGRRRRDRRCRARSTTWTWRRCRRSPSARP